MKKTYPFKAYLTKKNIDNLKAEAKKRKVNESVIVREALRIFFRGKANPNTEKTVTDSDLDELLDDCTDWFGRFITTPTDPDDNEAEGFFYHCADREINLGQLTEKQWERVIDKLVYAHEGFLFKPPAEEYIEDVESLGAREDQLQQLRIELGVEEPKETEEETEESTEETATEETTAEETETEEEEW